MGTACGLLRNGEIPDSAEFINPAAGASRAVSGSAEEPGDARFQVPRNGLLRPLRVACADRLVDFAVLGQDASMALVERPLGKAARQLDAELHLAAQRLERRDEEPVLRSPRDRQVELEVSARSTSRPRRSCAPSRRSPARCRRSRPRGARSPRASPPRSRAAHRNSRQRCTSGRFCSGPKSRRRESLRRSTKSPAPWRVAIRPSGAQAPERLSQHRPRDAELLASSSSAGSRLPIG